jgi:hypothetical protein
MSASSIRAGQAFWEILAKDKTQPGLSSAQDRMKAFAGFVKALGADLTSVARRALDGLRGAVMAFTAAGDALGDRMTRTGLSGGFLQTLEHDAIIAGASIQDVESSVVRMNRVIGAAAGGNKAAAKALAELGLSADQLLSLSPDERFLAIAEALSKITDPALQTAAAMQIFGRGAAKLREILAGGGTGLLASWKGLKAQGRLISDEDIALAGNLDKAWGELNRSLSHSWQLIGAALAPAMLQLIGTVQPAIVWTMQFINVNRGLVQAVAIAAAFVGALGVALTTAAVAIRAYTLALSIARGVTLAYQAAVAIATAAQWAFNASVLANPYVLIIGSVIVLTAAIATLSVGFENLREIAGLTFGGIMDALSAGNWQLAGEIMMAGLKAAMTRGFANLMELAVNFAAFLLTTINAVMQNIAERIEPWAARIGLEMPDFTAADDVIENLRKGAIAHSRAVADAAMAELKRLAEEAKKQKEAIGGKPGDDKSPEIKIPKLPKIKMPPMSAGQTIFEFDRSVSQGAFQGAAAARLPFNQPQVDVLERIDHKMDDMNKWLEEIEKNTEEATAAAFGE